MQAIALFRLNLHHSIGQKPHIGGRIAFPENSLAAFYFFIIHRIEQQIQFLAI